MAHTTTQAKIGNTTLKCPICGGMEFRKKKYLLTGTWLQAFDMEGFGRDALILQRHLDFAGKHNLLLHKQLR